MMFNNKTKLKIVVIGDSSTGKSSLIRSIISKPFLIGIEPTLSYQLSLLQFNFGQKKYQIQLWDCGQNHFQYNQLTRHAFFLGASAVFITFDLTNLGSLEKVPIWIHQSHSNQCFNIYIFAMKKDLLGEIDQFRINSFLQQYKVQYFLYSSKQYKQKVIRQLFSKIDNDRTIISRSTLVKGLRYSRMSSSNIFGSLQQDDWST